jgi:hypothetical protein
MTSFSGEVSAAAVERGRAAAAAAVACTSSVE